MRDRGIDADDQVQLSDRGRCVREVVQPSVQVPYLLAAWIEPSQARGTGALLQAPPGDAGYIQQWSQQLCRTGALSVVAMGRIAGPNQADAQASLWRRF